MKVYGLNHLSKRIPELLMKDVKDKYNPDNWTWKPTRPEKIRNLLQVIQKEKDAVKYAAMTNYIPSNVKQNIVLLFSMGNLNYGLIKQLEDHNIKFAFIDYVQFIVKGTIIVYYDNDKKYKRLEIENIKINLDDVKVVLWNPPKFPAPLFNFSMIPSRMGRHQYLFEKRWAQFLRDLKYLIPNDATWLPSHPLNGSQEWQNKLGEYELAREIGFNIPAMIFSNGKKEIKTFTQKHGNRIVLREFATPPFNFPPVKVNLLADSMPNIKSSPCCFQKYIEKEYELRVVVLFDKVFPCKIYSQDSALATEDWRVHDDANVKWELVEIPEKLKEKMLALSKRLNLNWCSIDLIYSTDKKYYFLEANRPGAHYWLDLFVGLDISSEIIKCLIEKKLLV